MSDATDLPSAVLHEFLDPVAAGRAVVPIHRVQRLDQSAEAHAELAAGRAAGKLAAVRRTMAGQPVSVRSGLAHDARFTGNRNLNQRAMAGKRDGNVGSDGNCGDVASVSYRIHRRRSGPNPTLSAIPKSFEIRLLSENVAQPLTSRKSDTKSA